MHLRGLLFDSELNRTWCKLCFRPGFLPQGLRKHQTVHNNGNKLYTTWTGDRIGYALPSLQGENGTEWFCPICDFTADRMDSLLAHMAVMHEYEELKEWGYRKDFLLKIYRDFLLQQRNRAADEEADLTEQDREKVIATQKILDEIEKQLKLITV